MIAEEIRKKGRSMVMKKRITSFSLLLLLILATSCKQRQYEVYFASEQPGWHKIDLGVFEVEVPDDYRYKPHQGIDSFVGQISNGKTTFEFDYGWYSTRHPLTPEEYFEENLSRLYFDRLLDSLPVSSDSTPADFTTLEKLKIINVEAEKEGRFMANLDLNGEAIRFRFSPENADWEQDYEQYGFIISRDESYYTKLFYPKQSVADSKSGVYIEVLESKREDKYGYDKLSFVTFNVTEANTKELIQILKTVTMKKEQD